MTARDAVLEHLFAKTTRRGIKLGLERIRAAAAEFGNPQQSYHSIHVAGTNGKGSVCAFLESALRHAGHRTGLFTSPHIVAFEERFAIDGAPVSQQDWLDVYQDLDECIERLGLTFFEAITLLAFEIFRRRDVRWAVFETGLGGRLDATNALAPDACVITTLGIDHAEYLGSTLRAIAREKLGIVKKGVPVVMAEPDDAGVRALARDTCAARSAPLFMVRPADISNVVRENARTCFHYCGREYVIPLYGAFQPLNASCAAKALDVLSCCPADAVSQGIGAVRLPGRFQVIEREGHVWVFDVGHNAQAAKVFAQSVAARFGDTPVCLVAGIMKDKDIPAMMASYAGVCDTFVTTVPQTDRACDASILASHVPQGFAGRVHVAPDVGDALERAAAMARGPICVTGSFYTVGEAMRALGIAPYSPS
ncbi:MAG: hypothetical protein GF418_07905 [Chitinivibrionales bacterium]|nr:hypothetical protein [Chitinivibrionales bacterium]MBD3395536.1 hypothetical protein [Chitinivibrionales bacterium]